MNSGSSLYVPNGKPPQKTPHSWWFKLTFLGWLSDPFKGWSDLQVGDEKGHFESPGFCCAKKFCWWRKNVNPLISQESTASTALTARAPLLQFHSLPQQQRLGPFHQSADMTWYLADPDPVLGEQTNLEGVKGIVIFKLYVQASDKTTKIAKIAMCPNGKWGCQKTLGSPNIPVILYRTAFFWPTLPT